MHYGRHGRQSAPVNESRGSRVLVVEDDAAVRWLLRALVQKQGLSCDAVDDGQRAIAALETTSYALVVLDLLLPEVNGLRVLRRMDQLNLKTPVIVVTSVDDPGHQELGSQRVKRIVPKPFEMEDLAAEIRLLCGINNK